MFPIVGVDLGSEYMKLSAIPDSTWHSMRWEDNDGLYDIPLFYNTETKAIGRIAKEVKVNEQYSNIVYGVNQFIGANPNDQFLKKFLQIQKFPFKINFFDTFYFNGIDINDIAQLFFQNINNISNQKSGKPVKTMVLSIPTHFTYSQIDALRFIINNTLRNIQLKIFSESTSATFDYALKNKIKNGLFAHINIGATLELTVLRLTEGKKVDILKNYVYPVFISDLLDYSLIQLVIDKFCSKEDIDVNELSAKKQKMVELLMKCRALKQFFSSGREIGSISVKSFSHGKDLVLNDISLSDYILKIDFISDMILNIMENIDDDVEHLLITGSSAKFEHIKEQVMSYGEFDVDFPDASLGASALGRIDITEQKMCETVVMDVDNAWSGLFDTFFSNIIEKRFLNVSVGLMTSNDKFAVFIPKGKQLPFAHSFCFRIGADANKTDFCVYAGNNLANASSNLLLDIVTFEGNDTFLTLKMTVSVSGFLTIDLQTQNRKWFERVIVPQNILELDNTKVARLRREPQHSIEMIELQSHYRKYLSSINNLIKRVSSDGIRVRLLSIENRISKKMPSNKNELQALLHSAKKEVDHILNIKKLTHV